MKDLSKLSDDELIEYYNLFKKMNTCSKRAEKVKIDGLHDRKFLYHVVRLISEAEQILTEGDLDLQRSREMLKAVRRGEMSYEEVRKWFSDKERQLEELYIKSSLPHSPNEDNIKQLLLDCLEHHYGSLQDAVVVPEKAIQALKEINEVIKKYNLV